MELVVVTPNLLAVCTSVESGHRFISRTNLDLLEVGHIVFAIWTAR